MQYSFGFACRLRGLVENRIMDFSAGDANRVACCGLCRGLKRECRRWTCAVGYHLWILYGLAALIAVAMVSLAMYGFATVDDFRTASNLGIFLILLQSVKFVFKMDLEQFTFRENQMIVEPAKYPSKSTCMHNIVIGLFVNRYEFSASV